MLKHSAPSDSMFFYYFIQPRNEKNEALSVRKLRQEAHTVIFGEPGMGKTSLRLWLGAECRNALDHTLVVSCIFGEDIQKPLSMAEHDERLARALGIDLTIQVLEGVDQVSLPLTNADALDALRGQAEVGGRGIARLLKQILDDAQAKGHKEEEKEDIEGARFERYGVGMYWERVGRQAARYVPRSEALLKLVKALAERRAPPKAETDEAEKNTQKLEKFRKGIEVARSWNFAPIFLVIDGVDNRMRDPQEMFDLIEPLLEFAEEFQREKVFLKLFLPLEMRELFMKYLLVRFGELNPSWICDTIKWRKEDLHRLIVERFRAAGSSTIYSLDLLAEENVPEGLEDWVIAQSHGSPRHLLEIISQLIDTHLENKNQGLLFTQADWEGVKRKMSQLRARSISYQN